MKISTVAGLTAGLITASVVSANAVSVAPSGMSLTVISADCDPNVGSNGMIPIQCGSASDANGHDRTDSSHVNLGAADGDFYSLGLAVAPQGSKPAVQGGLLVLRIDPAFTGPAIAVEVTNPSNHWEAAEVFVSNDGIAFQSVGLVNNGKGGSEAVVNTVSINGIWKYLAFADASLSYYGVSGSVDGFDLDAIKVSAVPVPAGVLLLGTALAGLGVARRKA